MKQCHDTQLTEQNPYYSPIYPYVESCDVCGESLRAAPYGWTHDTTTEPGKGE